MKAIGRIQAILNSFKSAWEDSKTTRIGKALRNKYILTALLFFVWLLFFDQNNLAERRKTGNEFNQLNEEKNYYEKKIEEDRKRITELKTDADNLEKFAREQYLMKKDNEDIFIIVE
jgi:cell division protein FtsB